MYHCVDVIIIIIVVVSKIPHSNEFYWELQFPIDHIKFLGPFRCSLIEIIPLWLVDVWFLCQPSLIIVNLVFMFVRCVRKRCMCIYYLLQWTPKYSQFGILLMFENSMDEQKITLLSGKR